MVHGGISGPEDSIVHGNVSATAVARSPQPIVEVLPGGHVAMVDRFDGSDVRHRFFALVAAYPQAVGAERLSGQPSQGPGLADKATFPVRSTSAAHLPTSRTRATQRDLPRVPAIIALAIPVPGVATEFSEFLVSSEKNEPNCPVFSHY